MNSSCIFDHGVFCSYISDPIDHDEPIGCTVPDHQKYCIYYRGPEPKPDPVLEILKKFAEDPDELILIDENG